MRIETYGPQRISYKHKREDQEFIIQMRSKHDKDSAN